MLIRVDQVLQVPRLVDAADVADPQRDTPALLTYVALLRRQALLVQRQRMVKFERGLSVCLCVWMCGGKGKDSVHVSTSLTLAL